MTDEGWHRAFDDPISLPDSRKLITLHDAATFITTRPKREHDAPEWQAAIEALMLVVERGGPCHVRADRRGACAQPRSQAATEEDEDV
ncbi:hypothetical protein GGD63_001911 [Bradyrhizobium sp. cir1]|uniref:hypothetical protein n=1 Tax=Bradyrhizobium sp. cir1 TaxID=1445730 RepID=UPI0018552D2B|nr:hypothetical protein [Bradyrhizobium sp. cir1]MBB4369123.1 hypothetical protein [Bradyrhizobium sp. cir1]